MPDSRNWAHKHRQQAGSIRHNGHARYSAVVSPEKQVADQGVPVDDPASNRDERECRDQHPSDDQQSNLKPLSHYYPVF